MKKILVFSFIMVSLFACNKVEDSSRFSMLTSNIWDSDSLLANGEDASGPGEMLEKFKGEARFNRDGSGHFGVYPGAWKFAYDEENIVISSDSLPIPLSTHIEELTAKSLKITTAYPNFQYPDSATDIRMTFIARE
jgi:hypothetical protein